MIQPLKEGVKSIGGEPTYRYKLFSKAAVLSRYPELDNEAIHELTGWNVFYYGPGQRFAEDPYVHVSRSKILITQRIGWDV